MPVPQQTVGNYSYTVPPIDIGSGYAAGITSAGKSLGQAITGIFGGVNEKGEVQQGVLEQNQTANDMLTTLNQMKGPSGNKVLPDEVYQSLMGKSLGAKQQAIGMYQGQWQANMQAQIDQARQIALARATAAAQAPYRIQEIQESGAQQRQTQAVTQAVQGERKVVIGNPNQQSTSDSASRITTSLGSALQKSGQPSILDPNYKFNLNP